MLVKPSASAQTASAKTSVPVKSAPTRGLKSNYGLRTLVGISLALHGALLLLPMPQEWLRSAPEPEDLELVEESGAIALTTLPVVTQPLPEKAPVPVAPSVLEVAPIPPPITSALPPQAPLTQIPDELPEQLENVEEIELLDDEPAPEPPPEEELEQTESPLETSEPEAGIAVQFSSDFPHITGSESGCYGLENCRRAEGENYTDALKTLSQQLEAQGYELTPYDDNDDSDVRNHRVYEMRLPNDPDAEVNYLNVLGDGLKAAIYIITPHLITQADLQALENDHQTGE